VTESKAAFTSLVFRRILRTLGYFLKSPVGGKAKWLLAALFLLMFLINGMNVVNSFVGRNFMSAIESRDTAGFVRFAWLYVAVFAGSTFVGVMFRFTEERLGLLWRDFLTHRVVRVYIDRGIYLQMSREGAISNPDQRITEDIRQLTTTTLSFVLMVINGTMTVLSFSGVLWTISPKLFMVAVLYAVTGSALTIWLGRPLIKLNYRQSDCEANFRSDLIWTHEHADEIAREGNQATTRDRLLARVDDVVGNFRRVISINRNLNFFTSGYNYLIQLIPVLIVAPLFIRREVEFGVIGQATMAFATLLGAFSLIITQFQAISAYASVILRLGEFVEAAEKGREGNQNG
jgi:vitamin B12/bleomycin/antimicrobial peptide transport system ATP-binding/permease protein